MEQVDNQQANNDQVQDDPKVLQNEAPSIINNLFFIILQYVQSYGWLILLAVALLMYLKYKLQPRYDQWQQKREEEREYQNYDSDEALRKQEAMEAARRRLQEKYDEQAASHAEKQKEKEEQKRREKAAEWDKLQAGQGYHSKYKPKEEEQNTDKSKKDKRTDSNHTYRPADYLPLGGGASRGSEASFRFSGRRSGRGG